jgi:hypothetical protein
MKAGGVNILCIGAAVFIGGIIYDIAFAGAPYQDPTPEMQQRHEVRSRVAAAFYVVCCGVIVAELAVLVARSLQSRRSHFGAWRSRSYRNLGEVTVRRFALKQILVTPVHWRSL